MLPDPDWKADNRPGVGVRTKDKDNDDDQGIDIPAWMPNQKTEKSALKKRDSKPAQPKENEDHARRSMRSRRAPLKRSVLPDQL